MSRVVVLLILLLGACVPQSGTLVTGHTDLTASYSPQAIVAQTRHHTLMGHLIDVTRAGDRVRALVIGHRRDGVNRLFMAEAWSDGVQLPFQATHRRLDGCTHGHCRDHALGMVFLSDRLFEFGLHHGLVLRLVGSGDAVTITVPATLFAALPENPGIAAQ